MLDNHGFVSETNATNLFMVKNEVVFTPCADACLPGITRSNVIHLCRKQGIELIERNISVSEFYNADEVFTTGSMGELTKVYEIDGRSINNTQSIEVFEILQHAYLNLCSIEGEVLPF